MVSKYAYTYDDRGYIIGETAIESLAGYAYDDKHNGKHTEGKHDDLYPHGTKHAKHDKDATFAYRIVQTDRTFTYDDAGKLLSATETEDNYGTYIYTYEYDLMGNRSAMTKTAEDGTVAEWHKYVYNDSNQLVSEELYNGKKTTKLNYEYDADGNRISEVGKIGTDKVEKYYEYDVENRLAAVYDADELLMAAAYDGDGNRVFQLNYNLHTDNDWKGNSGNGNGNNKDNKGSGNNGKGSSNNGKGNSKSEGADDAGYGNATNAEENNSQNQSGILFPVDNEVSDTEQSLIDKIKTTGKHKNYELIEYINDVNREYTEVLVEQNINGKTDTSYIYGVDRLSHDRFDGSTGYYLYDPRGSVTGITNEEGQIYQSYRYSVNGEITYGAPQYENEYTYNGESYNPNIESQYLRTRYYDVVTANFLTEDSYLGNINEPLPLNRYNYCISSYLNYQDPSGNKSIKEFFQGGVDWFKDLFSDEDKAVEIIAEPIAILKPIPVLVVAGQLLKEVIQNQTDEYVTYVKSAGHDAEENRGGHDCERKEYVTLEQLKNDIVVWNFREIVDYDLQKSLPTYQDPENGRDINATDIDEINRVLEKYNINTPNRIAHFLAQCHAETDAGLRPVEQFTGDDIYEYFKAYEEEGNSLGNTQKGDGAKYRGAGALQLTGRDAYEGFCVYVNDSKILDDGALYVGKEYFWESAAYYWSIYKPSTASDDRYNLNKKCDEGASVETITKIINGAYRGLDKRQNAYDYYKEVIE